MTKITLDDEYRALESLIESKFPNIKLLSYNPKEPNTSDGKKNIEDTWINDAVFELIDSSNDEQNRAIVKKLRTYQLLFYFDKQTTAMVFHSKIDSLFENTASIPCEDRFIKLESYSMSRIFKTEGSKFAFYSIVEANFHEQRTFDEVPKMASVTTSISVTINK